MQLYKKKVTNITELDKRDDKWYNLKILIEKWAKENTKERIERDKKGHKPNEFIQTKAKFQVDVEALSRETRV